MFLAYLQIWDCHSFEETTLKGKLPAHARGDELVAKTPCGLPMCAG
jgi:hypothetical protein